MRPYRWLVPALWGAAAGVAALQCAKALTRRPPDWLADLHVYTGGVRLLLDGGSLYDFAAHNGAPFTYPPFAGLLFVPLALAPDRPLGLAWTAATLAVVIMIAAVTARAATDAATVRGTAARRPAPGLAVPAVALLLLASAPIYSNLRFGQVSVFLAAVVLVDCLGLVPPRLRGVATGVAAAVKLTPLIFIPYWLLAREWRTATNALVTCLACTVLGWLVLPAESARYWLGELWDVERVGNIATTGNQSLNGVLLRFDLPELSRLVIVAGVCLAVVATAYGRAVRAYRAGDRLAAAVVVGAAGLVVSPVSWTHHQVWLVLAALLAVSARPAGRLLWAAAVAAVMVLPLAEWGEGLATAPLTDSLRLLLAVAVACAVPLAGGTTAGGTTAGRTTAGATTAGGTTGQAPADQAPGRWRAWRRTSAKLGRPGSGSTRVARVR